MKRLILLEFSKYEKTKGFSLLTFKERGVNVSILRELSIQKPQSGNLYKFGVIDSENKMYWFFNGQAEVKGRINAIKTFSDLQTYCKMYNVGKPFLYKSNK